MEVDSGAYAPTEEALPLVYSTDGTLAVGTCPVSTADDAMSIFLLIAYASEG